MPDSPNFRVTVGRVRVRDGLQNFEARLGVGTDNQLTSSTYGLVPVTRNRALLDNMYRGSWITRQAVGVIADDMTRAGVEITGVKEQDGVAKLQNALQRMNFWGDCADGTRWGRLYGGAIGAILVDGQRLSDPLEPDSVRPGSLRGLSVIDRWSLTPSSELVTELGPDFGKPVSYDVLSGINNQTVVGNIHHTRVVRFTGDDLPSFQRQYENGWGMSVIEPLHDRLVAFDSTTMGTAQMVFRAYLRVLKMKNLRKSIADGGKAFEAAISQIETMRRYQTIEGISVIDSEDDFTTVQYGFSGLADVLIQMAQQLAGALGIPLVKLFGMSPAGFSTGETDLRNYYDGVNLRQERRLRRPLEVFLGLLHRSELGEAPGPGFGFKFAPLWGMSAKEKAEVASTTATAVGGMFAQQVIDRSTALRELQAVGQVTGVFASVTQEDVDKAVEEEARPELPALPGEGGDPADAQDPEQAEQEQTEAVSDPEPGSGSARARDSVFYLPTHTRA